MSNDKSPLVIPYFKGIKKPKKGLAKIHFFNTNGTLNVLLRSKNGGKNARDYQCRIVASKTIVFKLLKY